MSHYRSIYATFKDQHQAAEIGRLLVSEKLVACVNLIEEIRSIYQWDGKLEEEGEAAFYAKTTQANVDKVIARIVQLHTYTTPCIVVFPIETGHQPYLDWIDQSVGS
jgi:periplasmic divalent cation tolerance protein